MEILNYKQINKGCLVGRFDVKIAKWGLTIRGCLYFEKEGKRWVSMPSSRIENKDGSVKNFDHVILDKSTRSRFDTACLEKLKNGHFKEKDENSQIRF